MSKLMANSIQFGRGLRAGGAISAPSGETQKSRHRVGSGSYHAHDGWQTKLVAMARNPPEGSIFLCVVLGLSPGAAPETRGEHIEFG